MGWDIAITINRRPHFGTLMNNKLIYGFCYSGHGLAVSVIAGKLISEYLNGDKQRFKFFSEINHMSIPMGSVFRRPIYSSAIFYYKMRDTINNL